MAGPSWINGNWEAASYITHTYRLSENKEMAGRCRSMQYRGVSMELLRFKVFCASSSIGGSACKFHTNLLIQHVGDLVLSGQRTWFASGVQLC